jgi:hypothetical protein
VATSRAVLRDPDRVIAQVLERIGLDLYPSAPPFP